MAASTIWVHLKKTFILTKFINMLSRPIYSKYNCSASSLDILKYLIYCGRTLILYLHIDSRNKTTNHIRFHLAFHV